MLARLHVCLCVREVAAPECEALRAAQEVTVVARHRQHQPDRGLPARAHGRQRPQRPLRQVPAGAPEVQEQGVCRCSFFWPSLMAPFEF